MIRLQTAHGGSVECIVIRLQTTQRGGIESAVISLCTAQLRKRCSIPGGGKDIFLIQGAFRLALGPIQPHIQWFYGKGPHRLLQAGSQVAQGQTAVSGIPNCVN